MKVKFLTVIWGARYIEEFARVSLPSYLAPGNLPFMAEHTDLEVLVMTSADSVSRFNEEAAFQRLRGLCSVRFILIDDLISKGIYAVTLTIAYARGIADSGPNQTSTHFVFMNSDFVLAENSLRSLVARMSEGHRCVMAPSLRARSENVLPELLRSIDPVTGAASLETRDLVGLAFANLHPTVVAKTITQSLLTCVSHNQIYWQVDEATMLARCPLLFMLAIKPEVPLGRVNSYCDYGFVPEMVPSGEFVVMDDSDDFFMLELQSTTQEKELLRAGSRPFATIGADLSFWTTREHRRFAEAEIVFHSGALPRELPRAREQFAEAFRKLKATLGAPIDHVDHFFWVGGVQAWASLKQSDTADRIVLPPELGEQYAPGVPAFPSSTRGARPSVYDRIQATVSRSYLATLGRLRTRMERRPDVPLWHHLWLDGRLVLDWLRTVRQDPRQRSLVICREGSPLSTFFVRQSDIVVRLEPNTMWMDTDMPEGSWTAPIADRFDHVLLHVHRGSIRGLRSSIEATKSCINPGGSISVYVDLHTSDLTPGDFALEVIQSVEDILPKDWIAYGVTARFAGGSLKRGLRTLERQLFRYLRPSSIRWVPHLIGVMLVWPLIAALMTAFNLTHRRLTDKCPKDCSSFLLTLSRRAPHVTAAPPVIESRSAA